MNTNHFTDEAIQDFILLRIEDEKFDLHISECPECKAKMESYKVLMNALSNLEPETFSFDVTALVMKKIEVTETETVLSSAFTWFTITSIFILAVIILNLSFLKPIIQIFLSLSLMDNTFILISALCVFIFLAKDVISQYKQKEKLLLQ